MLIDIALISLDVKNFRHGDLSTEREAIQSMLGDEKTHKVAELAEDIVSMGQLDPSSRLIVTEDAANPGQFIALEGNRRMTALKALINPNLATGFSTYSIFKKLSAQFMSLGITQVECVVLDRAQAAEWIKRKHYNAMGGRGVIAWNAVATARSDASEGRPPRWMMALNLLGAHGKPVDGLLDGIASKTTTVERVFSSTHMSSILGVTFDVKSGLAVAENGDAVAAAELLEAMLSAMADKSFVETMVTNAAMQGDYIRGFAANSVKKVPPQANRTQNAGWMTGTASTPVNSSGNSTTASTLQGGSTGGQSSASGSPVTGAGTAVATARTRPVKYRKGLADKGLRITNDALNKLYGELRKLNVEASPHVASVMVRVFLEKATLVFLEDMAIQCPSPKGWRDFSVKLKDKVSGALNTVDPRKSNASLQYVRDVANGVQNKVHTLDNLNHAVHDHQALPSARDILTIWDRYHPYFVEIFKTLEMNGK